MKLYRNEQLGAARKPAGQARTESAGRGKGRPASSGCGFNVNIFRKSIQLIRQQKMENSQEFQPASLSYQAEEHFIHPKRHQKYVSGENNGKWSELEHARYIAYLEFHRDKMRSKERRRANKFYKEMSRFIATRNALQCRSHHQKLEDRFLYPNKIIASYKHHYDLALYHAVTQELQEFEGKSLPLTTSHLKLQSPQPEVAIQTDFAGLTLNYVLLPPQNAPNVAPYPALPTSSYSPYSNGCSFFPMGEYSQMGSLVSYLPYPYGQLFFKTIAE